MLPSRSNKICMEKNQTIVIYIQDVLNEIVFTLVASRDVSTQPPITSSSTSTTDGPPTSEAGNVQIVNEATSSSKTHVVAVGTMTSYFHETSTAASSYAKDDSIEDLRLVEGVEEHAA